MMIREYVGNFMSWTWKE